MKNTLHEMKEAFDALSPFIEKHTSSVCPLCPKVCCIDRHCYYEDGDLLFIKGLDPDALDQSPDRADTAPCRFLMENGCLLPRWRRPFRCTWYFCERLLEAMRNDRGRDYRSFVEKLQRLRHLRENFFNSSDAP